MNVPIIGQPMVLDWTLNVAVRCVCEQHPTLIVSGKHALSVGVCSGCGAVYQFSTFPQFSPEGRLMIGLSMQRMPQPGEVLDDGK